MMNKKRLFFAFFGVLIVVVGVITVKVRDLARNESFPVVDSFFVVPQTGNIMNRPRLDGVISPDGEVIYTSLHSKVELASGLRYSNELAYDLHLDFAQIFIDVSPSGRFLTAGTGSPKRQNLLLDMKEKTYRENSRLCKSWSVDETRCVDYIYHQLVEMPSARLVKDWNVNIDFRRLEHFSGDNIFLWDTVQNIPVAEIYPCLESTEGIGNAICLGSLSYDGRWIHVEDGRSAATVRLLEVSPPQEIVSFIFDPTGRYILVGIWEHEEEYTAKQYDYSNVKDSILMLVDWRTLDSVELFRLSSAGIESRTISRGTSSLEWSSDGSTILVRLYGETYNIPPLVLKLEYP